MRDCGCIHHPAFADPPPQWTSYSPSSAFGLFLVPLHLFSEFLERADSGRRLLSLAILVHLFSAVFPPQGRVPGFLALHGPPSDSRFDFGRRGHLDILSFDALDLPPGPFSSGVFSRLRSLIFFSIVLSILTVVIAASSIFSH